jgi:hypothetical protein
MMYLISDQSVRNRKVQILIPYPEHISVKGGVGLRVQNATSKDVAKLMP